MSAGTPADRWVPAGLALYGLLLVTIGLLFPGTYSRRDSLRRGARDGMKLVLALVPVFVVAGFLEGFVTRHTEMPLYASLSIIGLSATFILGYFVVYPWWLARQAG